MDAESGILCGRNCIRTWCLSYILLCPRSATGQKRCPCSAFDSYFVYLMVNNAWTNASEYTTYLYMYSHLIEGIVSFSKVYSVGIFSRVGSPHTWRNATIPTSNNGIYICRKRGGAPGGYMFIIQKYSDHVFISSITCVRVLGPHPANPLNWKGHLVHYVHIILKEFNILLINT